jgi:hypothetical protein
MHWEWWVTQHTQTHMNNNRIDMFIVIVWFYSYFVLDAFVLVCRMVHVKETILLANYFTIIYYSLLFFTETMGKFKSWWTIRTTMVETQKWNDTTIRKQQYVNIITIIRIDTNWNTEFTILSRCCFLVTMYKDIVWS